MYTALYRAHRPEVFDEILGQEHIIKILKNQIETDSVSHAYLFCGTRGTGKTTTARILAKGLNCLAEDGDKPCGRCSACTAIRDGVYLDVIEIDAASNNGVDNIRELRESVKYPPAVGRKKVYIIDEVHMLSTGAFNALLKTLEEPPEYVVFILATTEPQKLPATILSRCMRLDFRRVPEEVIIKGMADICQKRSIDVSEDALRIIAANADGSVRDGLSILEQCIAGGDTKVGAEDVLEFLGASGEETFMELTDLVRWKRTADALVLVAKALSDGKDVRQFMRDWINHYRNLLMVKFIRDPRNVLNLSAENIERIRRQSESTDLVEINNGILELSKTMNEAKWSTQPRILLELAIVKLSSDMERSVKTAAPKAVEAEPVRNEAAAANVGSGSANAGAEPGNKMPERENSKPESRNAEPEPDVEHAETKDAPAEPREEASFDLEKVWSDVLEDGEAERGSLYIMRAGSRLTDIGENEFTIAAESEYVKAYAEKNREIIEGLMERHTGARRAMKLAGGEKKQETSDKSAEEIAREAEDILGIDIEIR